MSIRRNSTLTTWLLSNVDNPDGAMTTANTLAGDGSPKLKFLFTVEFAFRQSLGGADRGSRQLQLIKYDLKNATRPNVSINQEDVNFYNYRTKVATRANYGTIKLTFYEDCFNTSNDLLWNYIKAISPIASYSAEAVNTTLEVDQQASSIGPMLYTDGPIQWLKLHHHYIRSSGSKEAGKTEGRVTTYKCLNPKIESVEMDDLDMSSSEASSITVTFTIDGVIQSDESYEE